jgi:hypothetical protein
MSKLVKAFWPFLTCYVVPIAPRVLFLKSKILGSVSYGGELFGSSRTTSTKLDRVLQKAVRLLFNRKGSQGCMCWPVAARELNIPSIHGKFAAAQVRAGRKWPSSTTIAKWAYAPTSRYRAAHWSWSDKTQALMRRVNKAYSASTGGTGPPTRWIKDLYVDCIGKKTKRYERYVEAGLGDTRSWIKSTYYYPKVALGAVWVLRARAGRIWLPYMAAAAELIPECFRDGCLYCGNQTDRDLAHIIVDCRAFRTAREECLLAGTINQLRNEGVRVTSDIATVLMGGHYSGGAFNFLEASAQEGTGGFGPVRMAGWLQLACFLHRVMPIVQGKLWNLRKEPQDNQTWLTLTRGDSL